MLFIIVLIIVGVAIYFIMGNFKEEKEFSPLERLARLQSKDYRKLPNEDEKNKDMDFLIHDSEYKIQFLGDILSKYNFFNIIKKQLKIADITMTADVFLLMSVIPLVVCLLLCLVISPLIHIFFVAGMLIAVAPFVLLNMRIKKRYSQFTNQFPDALGMISSSLRAGHSLLSSFQMVAREMPEPVCVIFKTVSDDITLGRDTRDALNNMTEQLPKSLDLRFFVTAVLIQREIGGNLAEILDSLSYTIRERFKLLGQISTQTAQAKLSGIVLAVAPFFIAGVISVLNPKYLEPLLHELIGQIALGTALFMAGLGYFVINKITDIRV